jgi:hypothetical protein
MAEKNPDFVQKQKSVLPIAHFRFFLKKNEIFSNNKNICTNNKKKNSL